MESVAESVAATANIAKFLLEQLPAKEEEEEGVDDQSSCPMEEESASAGELCGWILSPQDEAATRP